MLVEHFNNHDNLDHFLYHHDDYCIDENHVDENTSYKKNAYIFVRSNTGITCKISKDIQYFIEHDFIQLLDKYNAAYSFRYCLIKLGNTYEMYNIFKNIFINIYYLYLENNNGHSKDCINICRKKTKQKRCVEFILKYIYNVLSLRFKPYYDEVQDEMDKYNYYKNMTDINYNTLNNLLSSTYKHNNRRIGLWALAERHEDGTLRCVYTNKLLETNDCIRVSKADEEHGVPQSWYRGSKSHPGTDMHNIFIVDKDANSTRGNAIYGVLDDVIAKRKIGGYIYAKPDTGKKNYTYFLPHNNIGIICRATLYAMVCYKNTYMRSYFPEESLNWIIENAVNIPVTLWEKHRNREIYLLQRNRNPFIDNPHWAKYVDFTKGYINDF